STAFEHSPTISISLCSCKNTRRFSRANGSSSTIKTLIMPRPSMVVVTLFGCNYQAHRRRLSHSHRQTVHVNAYPPDSSPAHWHWLPVDTNRHCLRSPALNVAPHVGR